MYFLLTAGTPGPYYGKVHCATNEAKPVEQVQTFIVSGHAALHQLSLHVAVAKFGTRFCAVRLVLISAAARLAAAAASASLASPKRQHPPVSSASLCI